MSVFIDEALAQNGAAPPGGAGLEFIIMIGIFFAIMYFMIIRPQSKRAKEHKQLVESLSKGDEVVTTGGLAGRITDVDETFIRVEIARGTDVNVQKQSVSAVMPKGTLKDTGADNKGQKQVQGKGQGKGQSKAAKPKPDKPTPDKPTDSADKPTPDKPTESE